jgi:hypothetical protein
MEDTQDDDSDLLQIPLHWTFARRLDQAAAQRGMSAVDLAREAIERALADMPNTADAHLEATELGYRWKNVFLPEGTVLSFIHQGTPYLAVVKSGEILYEDRAVSPSEFVNGISGAPRNAWRDIWVKRPSDAGWVAAQDIRREATSADLSKQSDFVGARIADAIAGTEGPALAASLISAFSHLERRRPGFGSVPISYILRLRYLAACPTVIRVIETHLASDADMKHISETKGMFDRVVRQDLRDWKSVQQMLGMPDRTICMQAASWLSDLGTLIKTGEPITEHLARPAAAVVKECLRKALAECMTIASQA